MRMRLNETVTMSRLIGNKTIWHYLLTYFVNTYEKQWTLKIKLLFLQLININYQIKCSTITIKKVMANLMGEKKKTQIIIFNNYFQNNLVINMFSKIIASWFYVRRITLSHSFHSSLLRTKHLCVNR